MRYLEILFIIYFSSNDGVTQLGNKLFFSISVLFISMMEETHEEKKGSQKKFCYY
jgi:hypothetical protein